MKAKPFRSSFLVPAIAFALAIPLASGPAPARAAAPTETPKARIEATADRIQTLAATATEAPKMLRDMEVVLEDLVDYDAFAKKTLKGTWETLKSADRDRFKASFKRLVSHTYAKRFKPGTAFDTTFRGEPAFLDAERSQAEVKTTVSSKKVAADVDYSLAVVGESAGAPRWMVTDITIDGVSMALNWRSQFQKVVDREGFDALVDKIDKKVAKLEKG